MPIVRKIMNLRTSKAVCLPKSWLKFLEKETGIEIREVAIEVNGILKIRPILERTSQVPIASNNKE